MLFMNEKLPCHYKNKYPYLFITIFKSAPKCIFIWEVSVLRILPRIQEQMYLCTFKNSFREPAFICQLAGVTL